MKHLVAAAVACGLCGVSGADEIEVQPGQWIYEVSAMMGFLPLVESGNECVTEQAAKRSLSRTAASLGNGCAISSTAAIESGYRFVMRCQGDLTGEIDGEITTSGEVASLRASGWVSQEGVEVPLSVSGKARRTSPACF